jgi:large conductance mechanosensitive channel
MGFFAEFKKFALRGNVIDMAVGIVIGGAFTNIVNALVKSVFTPVTAYLTGNRDISGMAWELPGVLPGQEGAMIGWGAVAQAIVQFMIVALVLFLVVRMMNRLRLQELMTPAPAATPEDVLLLREIRDALTRK